MQPDFDNRRKIGRIDLADAVHAGERKHDLPLRSIGDRAEHEAGIAALRHDRKPKFPAGFHGRRHLLRRARANHRHGAAGYVAMPVAAETEQFLRFAQHDIFTKHLT